MLCAPGCLQGALEDEQASHPSTQRFHGLLGIQQQTTGVIRSVVGNPGNALEEHLA